MILQPSDEVLMSVRQYRVSVMRTYALAGDEEVLTKVSRFDPDGRPLQVSIRNRDGHMVTQSRWAYDGQGNLTEEWHDADADIGQNEKRQRTPDWCMHTYGPDGRCTEKVRIDANGEFVSREEMRYDSDGQLTEDASHLFAYDSNGRLHQRTAKAEGTVVTYMYYVFGRKTSYQTTGADGGLLLTGEFLHYGGSERLLSRSVMDAQGNELQAETWAYDTQGRTVLNGKYVQDRLRHRIEWRYGDAETTETRTMTDGSTDVVVTVHRPDGLPETAFCIREDCTRLPLHCYTYEFHHQ
jgi:YD repeat-containing protein